MQKIEFLLLNYLKVANAEDRNKDVFSSAPLTFSEKWDDWETWKVPEKILQLAPYYKSGYDYDGLPSKYLCFLASTVILTILIALNLSL